MVASVTGSLLKHSLELAKKCLLFDRRHIRSASGRFQYRQATEFPHRRRCVFRLGEILGQIAALLSRSG